MNKNYIYFGLLLLVFVAWAFMVPLIRQRLNRGGQFNKLGWGGTNRETQVKKEDDEK
jgi:hypothetical protein